MRDTFALGGGPYHFFARSSRRAAASSIYCASSFFSLAFSSSSCFRRLASGTSMPPYLAFQLYSVASETPCLRARSAVFAPASCSRSTPIICSSVNLARFICPPSQGRTLTPRGGSLQWQVTVTKTQNQLIIDPDNMLREIEKMCAQRPSQSLADSVWITFLTLNKSQ